MKRLYEFTLDKKEKVTKKVQDTNKDGEEIMVEKTVEENVPHKYFLRRPSRAMLDDAELYYGVQLAEGIRTGMITRPLLSKRYSNDGGIMNDIQQKALTETSEKIKKLYAEQEKIIVIDEKKRTAAQKKKLKQLEKDAEPLLDILKRYNMAEESIYEDTAESRARNKTILWWLLNLSYEEADSEEKPFFGDGDLETRLGKYDELDESQDEYLNSVVGEFMYNISLWYFAKPKDQQEFDKIKENMDKEE